MRLNLLAGSALLVGLAATAVQELPKRELRQKLKDTDIHPDWIYDDVPAALAAGAKSGKPILAVFRCVP
ncbi:MAG TPA: hypothetical protein VGK70_00730 [Thermoanaerobaculia bacterium]|jgi:hypothetical protein